VHEARGLVAAREIRLHRALYVEEIDREEETPGIVLYMCPERLDLLFAFRTLEDGRHHRDHAADRRRQLLLQHLFPFLAGLDPPAIALVAKRLVGTTAHHKTPRQRLVEASHRAERGTRITYE